MIRKQCSLLLGWLAHGDCFLDLGCGPGDYALEALKYVGPSGKIYAADKSRSLVDRLSIQVEQEGYKNIEVLVADITIPLPFVDSSVDVCFLSTVLHIYDLDQIAGPLFQEVRRILKPGGRLAVLECKKERVSFGPPEHMRLSAAEIETAAKKVGFDRIHHVDLGHNYLILFVNGLESETGWTGKERR